MTLTVAKVKRREGRKLGTEAQHIRSLSGIFQEGLRSEMAKGAKLSGQLGTLPSMPMPTHLLAEFL